MKRSNNDSRKGHGRKKKEIREERVWLAGVKVIKRFKGAQVIVTVPVDQEDNWSTPQTRHHKDGIIVLNSRLTAVRVMVPDPDAVAGETIVGMQVMMPKLDEKGKEVMEIIREVYCADVGIGGAA